MSDLQARDVRRAGGPGARNPGQRRRYPQRCKKAFRNALLVPDEIRDKQTPLACLDIRSGIQDCAPGVVSRDVTNR